MFSSLLHSLNAFVCLLFGGLANSLLIWLILKKTGEQMQKYSRILLQICLTDLLLLLVFFVLQPINVISGNGSFVVLNGFFAHSPQPLVIALYYLCSVCQEFSKYAVGVQFIYRWLTVCRQKDISNSLYCAMLAVPLGAALFEVLLMEFGRRTQSSIISPDQCVLCSGYTMAFAMDLGSDYVKMVSMIFLAFNALTYAVLIATNVGIWLKTRGSLSKQQKKTKEINRQIGLVLFVQVLLPLLVSLLPTLLLTVSSILPWSSSSPSGTESPSSWFTVIQNWPPLLYPLSTVLIVRSYRRAVFCRNGQIGTSTANGDEPRGNGLTAAEGRSAGGANNMRNMEPMGTWSQSWRSNGEGQKRTTTMGQAMPKVSG